MMPHEDERAHDPQRREVIKGLCVLLSAPLWLTFTPNILQGTESVTLQQFVALSKRLTKQDNIDGKTAYFIFSHLHQEAWGDEHLQRLITKLSAEGANQRLDFTVLNEEEMWFLGHVLTTWLTGLYFHEDGNATVTYRHALMHESLLDLRPMPCDCSQSFGFWQKKPEEHHG
jgi:hypothetical protein